MSRALGSNYELVSLIGTGAMGEVWRTLERGTGDEVAAKVLRSEYSRNPEIVARFIQERSILLGLEHPSIVRVRDLVVERDSLAIVMDLVDGPDLRRVLRDEGTLAPQRAALVTARVLEALAAAHSQGALHRDVKPDNVLLTRAWRDLGPDAVRLSDFSIARLAQDSTVQATGLLGTPEYMPPELFEHGTTSAASDVYSAGVLLYELLAGRTPFAGEGTAFTVGNRAVTMEPPPLDVPGPLWQLLSSLLSKDPRRRLKAGTAAATLTELADGLPDAPRLSVQPAPDAWRRTGAAELSREPIRPAAAPAAFDVGGTNLDVTFAPDRPAADPDGGVRALTPGARAVELAGLEDGVTNVGLPVRGYTAPALQPEVERTAPGRAGSSRARWLWIGLAALALVATVAGLALLLHGRGGAGPSGSGAVAGAGSVDSMQQAEKVPGTGLEVSRTAKYDPGHGTVQLSIAFTADRVALQGPFLQVLPMAAGSGECPLAAWDGAVVQPDSPLVSGITAQCAYRLAVPTVPANGTRTVTATFALPLHGDTQQALDAWLASAASATDGALKDTGGNNTSYAVQRLQDIVVKAPDFATTGTRQIRVVLYPEWSTGVDTQHPLFDSAQGESTDLLEQVAGGLANVRLTDGCNGAITIRDGLYVSVLHQADACAVDASVGNLTDLQSNTFQIANLGG